MTNIQSSLNQKQTKQHILRSGQKVYLYGETKFSGILVRPLERTYPPRWTVELDSGGYESPTVRQITLIDTQDIDPELAIPFDDSTIEEKKPETNTSQLETEITNLKKQIQELKAENERLQEELQQAKDTIRRAKDISPLKRISLHRVQRLAHDACLNVQRTAGGWILRLGKTARKFKRLFDVWEILSQDNWYLSDVFPEDKLIPIDSIQPSRRRKQGNYFRPKQPKQPFPITREDLLTQRELASFRYY